MHRLEFGNPSIEGVTIAPRPDGIYEVEPRVGAMLIEVFGFVDINAPVLKPATTSAAPANDELRSAVAATLQKFGIAVTGDVAMAKAIADLPDRINDQMLAAVKRAEHDTLTQFADENAALKTRAEKAEAALAVLNKKQETPPQK